MLVKPASQSASDATTDGDDGAGGHRRLMDLHREVERWDFFVLLDGAAQEFSLVIGDDVGEGVEKLSYFHLDGGDDFGGFCGFDASVGLGL
mgnify:CR=1 FL=1